MAKLTPTSRPIKNGKEILFRHLTAQDAETVLTYRKKIPQDSSFTLHYAGMPLPSVEDSRKVLSSAEQHRISLFMGAFDGAKLIGLLSLRPEHDGHPWVSHIVEFGMSVSKEYWGLGIGKILIDLMEEHAEKVRIKRIEAKVRVENERGVALYEHNGFEIEGTRKMAARIADEYMDEYYIAKILD